VDAATGRQTGIGKGWGWR